MLERRQLRLNLYDHRYSWEHWNDTTVERSWIAFHPSLMPCDPEGPVPRQRILEKEWKDAHVAAFSMTLNTPVYRKADYYLLPGLLFRWSFLYHGAPSESSWVWNWFPDGDYWKSRVAEHGVSLDGDLFPSTYEFSSELVAPTAVFYNVFVHPKDPRGINMTQSIVLEQLGQVAQSLRDNRDVTVYYNQLGRKLPDQWMNQTCQSLGLVCHLLGFYEKGHEEVTLNRVADYCEENEGGTAVYLHSKGAFHFDDGSFTGQGPWRRSLTAAAMHPNCLELSNSSCDACGLLFYPLPGSHFSGNMWSAKCSHIRKLGRPNYLLRRRTEVFRMVEDQALFDGKVCDWRGVNAVGLGRYTMEYWLGSHPSFVPCDLSPTPSMKTWREDEGRDFQFALAPRHPITANWSVYGEGCTRSSLDKALVDPERRDRELFLLSGKLFWWLQEFGQVPPDHSWVWDWFPDGSLWQERAMHMTPEMALSLGQPSSGVMAQLRLAYSKAFGVRSHRLSLGNWDTYLNS